MHIINIIFLPQNNRRTKWMDVKLFYKLPTVKQYIGTTKTVQEPSTSKTLFTKKHSLYSCYRKNKPGPAGLNMCGNGKILAG